jgi:hypothetical protein
MRYTRGCRRACASLSPLRIRNNSSVKSGAGFAATIAACLAFDISATRRPYRATLPALQTERVIHVLRRCVLPPFSNRISAPVLVRVAARVCVRSHPENRPCCRPQRRSRPAVAIARSSIRAQFTAVPVGHEPRNVMPHLMRNHPDPRKPAVAKLRRPSPSPIERAIQTDRRIAATPALIVKNGS